MIIGIDGNEANVKNRVGVGRYAYELLKQFFQIRNPKSEIRNKFQTQNSKFQIYLKDKPLEDLPKETDWWKYIIVKPKRLWTQIGLPFYLYTHFPPPDVFFTPSHYGPRFCPCPTVISVMDLSYLKFPEMFKKNDLWQLKNWTNYSVKKASRVLTISNSSASDIIKYYDGVKKEKVRVTYPGLTEVESREQQAESMENIQKKYGIKGDFILSVGTLQPRKNYVRLIEAFSRILNPLQGKQVQNDVRENLQLVIVGKKGWLWEEILEAPKKFGIEGKIRFLDYVSDEDLPDLYKKAVCFVLVSLYEGFGLPVLEAMSYGTPVIVSKTSSLPEVVGNAGILVDPENIGEISEAIIKVIKDKKIRNMMINKGFEQAKKFSWEKTAAETLKVLEEIGDKHV